MLSQLSLHRLRITAPLDAPLTTAIENGDTKAALDLLDDPELVKYLTTESKSPWDAIPGYEALLSAATRGNLAVLNKLLTLNQPCVLAHEKKHHQAYNNALQYRNFDAAKLILNKCQLDFNTNPHQTKHRLETM